MARQLRNEKGSVRAYEQKFYFSGNAWPLTRVATSANPWSTFDAPRCHGLCLPSFAAHYGGTSRAVAPAVVVRWAVAQASARLPGAHCRSQTVSRSSRFLGCAGAARRQLLLSPLPPVAFGYASCQPLPQPIHFIALRSIAFQGGLDPRGYGGACARQEASQGKGCPTYAPLMQA